MEPQHVVENTLCTSLEVGVMSHSRISDLAI